MSPDSLPSLVWRISQVEGSLKEAIEKAAKIPVLDERVNNLSSLTHELSEEVGALRRAILTASLSFAISAILIASTVYLVFK